MAAVRCLVAMLLAVVQVQGQSLRELGHFSASHAAFTALVRRESSQLKAYDYTLLISAFNPLPLFHDTIFEVTDIATRLSSLSTVRLTEVTRSVTWPNEVSQVPDAVFNRGGYVIAAGGFLVPLKDHGSLTLFDLALSPPVRHVVANSGADSTWFYHRVQWKDVNGDGLMDAVTCRAKTHLLGATEGQLVWFEHPRANALTTSWRSHVIAEGPDTYFRLTSLPTSQGPMDCIITAGFFSRSLNVYWTTDPQGRWDDASKVQSRVIDDTIGAVFDVVVADLNMDGTLDLLVTTNALRNASLLAYTVPSDFRTGQFQRRMLHSGYTSRQSGRGHGAPGSPLLVYPTADHPPSQRPLIALSGDDDGRAYLLQAASNDASDWSYQQTTVLDVGTSTVGLMSAGDVDGDGYTELFVPAFNQGRVYVFTFKP